MDVRNAMIVSFAMVNLGDIKLSDVVHVLFKFGISRAMEEVEKEKDMDCGNVRVPMFV